MMTTSERDALADMHASHKRELLRDALHALRRLSSEERQVLRHAMRAGNAEGVIELHVRTYRRALRRCYERSG